MGNQDISVLVLIKEFMRGGGPFMWVILSIWLLGMAMSIYKLLSLRRCDVNTSKVFLAVRGMVVQNNVKEAIEFCSNTKGIVPQVLRAGLKRVNSSKAVMEDAISASIAELTPKVNYQLSYISLLANISTLVGLLGTIQGLIVAFASIGSADPAEKSKLLAQGISEAMNTTAFGLVSAITIMGLHAVLVGKATKISNQVDEAALRLVDLINAKK